jgi:signal transduction histidine kinase
MAGTVEIQLCGIISNELPDLADVSCADIAGVPVRDVDAILEIMSSISSSLALDEILAEVTEKTAQILEADSCAISRWDRENNTVVVLADYVSPEVAIPLDDVNDVGAAYPLAHYPATARVLSEHTPLVVYADDPAADEAEKELLKAFEWDGVLMVPMLYKERAVGLMEVYLDDRLRYQFADDDVILCQALANQAAIAIQNAQLYQEAEEGRLQAEALQVISRALASELDYQRIVRNVAEFAYRLVGAQFVYVTVPEVNGFRPVAVAGRDEGYVAVTCSTGDSAGLLSQGPLGRAVEGKTPVVVADIQREPTFAVWREEADTRGLRAMVAVPLLSHNRVVGVLAAYARQPDFFGPGDVAMLMALASQAAVAIQNARLFAELEAQREALRHVSLRLVSAQEEERRRISRELHDELGQALTALKINLDVALRALPADASPKLRHGVQEARSLAAQTLETARSLSLELHPTTLDDLGLISALRWEIDRYEQRTDQSIHFEVELAGAVLQLELEITIYRVITEALTNVARHAQANHIRVYLLVENRQVAAGVEDDGVGFDAAGWFDSPAGRQSLGLVSMRERAELLGGRLEVISEPGRGTKVQVQLPIGD